MPICFVVHLFITIVNDGYLLLLAIEWLNTAATCVIYRYLLNDCIYSNVAVHYFNQQLPITCRC